MIEAILLAELVVLTPVGPRRVSGQVDAGRFGVAATVPEVGTALARVVVGLAAPVSGRIRVAGERDITDLAPGRRQIGYVPAGGALLPHLTVRDNIRYGLRRRELVHQVMGDWTSEVIDGLELSATLDLRPHQLSDGQRFRAAIARAVAGLPEVLVVDRPATGSRADRLTDLIERAAPEAASGMAVLVCSADPLVLAEVPDRVNVEEVAT